MRPCSMNAMRSALRIVDRRWAMTSAVRFSIAVSSAAWMCASLSLSRWLVASSSTMIAGFFSSSRAMARRCFSPPESR